MEDRFRIFLQHLARELGNEWVPDHQEPILWNPFGWGSGEPYVGLVFRDQSERVEVSRYWPASFPSQFTRSISCAVSRGTSKIAGDIERRLLPQYKKAYFEAYQVTQRPDYELAEKLRNRGLVVDLDDDGLIVTFYGKILLSAKVIGETAIVKKGIMSLDEFLRIVEPQPSDSGRFSELTDERSERQIFLQNMRRAH